jgi:hypothetical protein
VKLGDKFHFGFVVVALKMPSSIRSSISREESNHQTGRHRKKPHFEDDYAYDLLKGPKPSIAKVNLKKWIKTN